jgi:hypothetical protein
VGLRNQKQLQAVMDQSNRKAMGRMKKKYRRDIRPLLDAMKKATTPAQLQQLLGKRLLTRMGTDAMTETLGLEGAKAALGGVASATPRGTGTRTNG